MNGVKGSEGRRLVLLMVAVVVLWGCFQPPVLAQCPMCRTALIASEEGRQLAAGFNRGILFLVSIPFVTIGVIVFLIFQSTRRETETTITSKAVSTELTKSRS